VSDRSVIGQPGIGVDAHGGSVIDPTKNVEDLVEAGKLEAEKLRAADMRFLDAQLLASEKFQNFARESENRLQNFARDAESKIQTALRDSETRRIDQLADTRQKFLDTIRDMLAESVRTTSTLVSSQLVQIQATFDSRVTKLEAAQLTQAGRSSVADPAISDALIRINSALAAIQASESRVSGAGMGQRDTSARLLAVVMAVAAVASPVIAILVTIMAMRGRA
jgi:hypothetical protein